MYEVVFNKSASKYLRKLPRASALRIRDKIMMLAEDPFDENCDIKALCGREGYRLRVGDIRVIYTVKNDELMIHVLRIAPRGGVYQ